MNEGGNRPLRSRAIFASLILAITFALGGMTGISLADEGTVEERIAAFWERVNAMQPDDHLGAHDLGQWALNLIERDPRARLTVADFRTVTAAMQGAIDRAGPAPVSPQPTPTPAPTSTHFTFGAGVKVVGTDVPAGTYRMRTDPPGTCYWARLSGFGGTIDDIIANGLASERMIVTIAATDRGFESTGCGTWSADLSAVTPSADAEFGGGTYIVGVDVSAGTWQSNGTGTCYWARLSGFGGTLDELIANSLGQGTAIVDIAPADVGFISSGCGTWRKIS